VPEALAARQEVQQLGAEFATHSSWIAPEVLALPPGTVDRFLKGEKGLAPYEFFLHDLERARQVHGPVAAQQTHELAILGAGIECLHQPSTLGRPGAVVRGIEARNHKMATAGFVAATAPRRDTVADRPPGSLRP